MPRTLNSGASLEFASVASSFSGDLGTVAFWYKENASSTIRTLFNFRTSTPCEIELSDFKGIAALYVRLQHGGAGGASFVNYGTSFASGTLSHVAFTWDRVADSLILYINGTSVGTRSGATMTAFTGTVVNNEFGNNIWGEAANADFAECGIWGAVLTPAEITSLAKGFEPSLIRPASLLDAWRVSGRNSPEPGIRGNDLTITGTANYVATPYPLFTRPRRRSVGVGAPGPWPVDPDDGSFAFSGTLTPSAVAPVTCSGGMTLGGSASVDAEAQATAAAGLTLGGACSVLAVVEVSGSGSLDLAGALDVGAVAGMTALGTIDFAGSIAGLQAIAGVTAAGELVFDGTWASPNAGPAAAFLIVARMPVLAVPVMVPAHSRYAGRTYAARRAAAWRVRA